MGVDSVDSSNVQSSQTMGTVSGDDLQSPKDLPGILKKHDDLKAEATQQKRGRGRPRKDGGITGGGQRSEIQPVAEIFTPESIRPFVELPFTLSSVWFRSDVVLLEDREAETLSIQGATLANLYAPGWNPKAVALVAFSLGFMTIATGKIFALIGERQAQKRAEQEKQNQ